MTELHELLDELVTVHDAVGSPLRAALRPPLDVDAISEVLPQSLYGLDEPVVHLYAWHDGLDWSAWPEPGYPAVAPQFQFPSLSMQLEQQRLLGDMGLGELWRESLFPVFNVGRNVVAVDRAVGSLWYISIDSMAATPLCDSMVQFVRAVIKAFRGGIFVYRDGYLDVSTDSDPVAWLADSCHGPDSS